MISLSMLSLEGDGGGGTEVGGLRGEEAGGGVGVDPGLCLSASGAPDPQRQAKLQEA